MNSPFRETDRERRRREEEPEPRCWLYKGSEGRIFEGEKAIASAKKGGWKDTPQPEKKEKE